MMVCRFRAFAPVFLMALTFSALRADVTLRYKTEIKMNPTLPPQMTAAMGGADSLIPQDLVLRLKDGKGFSTAAGYNSITDFTAQEITLLDNTNSRYAKLKASQLSAVLADAAPKMPDEARAAIATMKTDVSPTKVTGRTAVIQGVETEEREVVITIAGPALPNAAQPNLPPGPMVRMVMQMWLAKPGEVRRVPAIRELTGYSLWTWATMNPNAGMEGMMKSMPGFKEVLEPLMSEMQKGTAVMRTHVDIFMPAMAAMLKQIPGGASFDPDTPFMQMTQEAVELSTAPVPASVFQIPEGFHETGASDLIQGVFAARQAAARQ
jgi:hypothetical protein